jgi:hypothetical protein
MAAKKNKKDASSKKGKKGVGGLIKNIGWDNVQNGFTNFLRFGLFTAAFLFLSYSLIKVSTVILRRDIVPDVRVPVSRFVANVDFETRTVEFDSTISKVHTSPMEIAIWRMGDGEVIKSNTDDEISENEVITHTFDQPGVYNVGYSIIDEDNLSDEATCTLSFSDGDQARDQEGSEDAGESSSQAASSNWVSDECGKSYTQYNSSDLIYKINRNKRVIRHSIIYSIMSLLVIVYSFLFIKPKKVVK